ETLEDASDVSRMLRKDPVKDLLDDDQIVEALRHYRLIKIIFDKNMKKLLQDESLIKEIMDMNLRLKDFPNNGLGDIIDEYFLNQPGEQSE
ncbi:MAG: hypothetical protein Q8Q33_09825, partial [Chlamydiota bacterium]|nr:hypothetical protein [Chlamydiota bacterium]